MAFSEKCKEFFGTSDFYEILSITKDATDKEIKKAYHKLSLLVHPDRVEEPQKECATEKFKVLGRIHSILTDQDKRKVYDDYGEFDEENDSGCNWMEYWRSMFKAVNLDDIKKYESEYIGSENELRDIKKAYIGGRGCMDYMLEMVPFANCDSEPRIREIVRKLIDNGEVKEYRGFFNESKAKAEKRRKRWEDEEKEVEQIDMEELEREIKQRAQKMSNFFAQLEDKYAPKKKKQRKSITGSASKVTKKARK